MTCLTFKMKRQLLVLLLVDFTAGVYLPTKETSSQQASASALFLVSNSQLPVRHIVDSLQENLASEVKQGSIDSDGISAPNKEIHRIKTRSSSSDGVGRTVTDFVFPIKPTAFIPKQDVKNCSVGGTDLCVSNVWDYPHRYIERLLENKTSRFQSYFTDDIVHVATRFDSSTDEELTCDAEETILYPKFGKTADNEMLFIINTDEKYRQGIRVEKCKKTGESPCNPKLEVPSGYRTYCKQKYIYRKLLALHPNGEPAPDNFKIPSCCSCFISKETE
ncbi:uncharacterized protein LOC126090775 [Schistocerca cancellata]|uniref:uncharacterized protein LOC126090775 n=1 Tax=Schistocerca cancellata TaxID=274614 RepID=UPI0021199084|nr:uncharacterized protein LOC126090775 [Schistocerca cancellata]